MHRVMVNWDPPKPAGWRQVPDPTMTEHGICPGRQFAIFIQVSNKGRFCQYISLPMKYTVSDSTLQYKVGLTLSFLSLISRGVGGIQKGNTSILYYRVVPGTVLYCTVPGYSSATVQYSTDCHTATTVCTVLLQYCTVRIFHW